MQPLFISVVVPVRNEAESIRRTLTQLLTQTYDPQRFEVIVVDGESTDGTPALVAEFAQRHDNLSLLENPRRLSSAARNIGIRHARGEVVVIVDGHCELGDDGYLSRLASAFQRSGAECVGRPQPLDITGASTLQRAIAAARSSWLGHHPDSHVYSSNEEFLRAESVAVAYRRSVFDQVGYFDETFDACEDVELNHRIDRAGLRCFFTPDAAVHYAPRATLGGLFRQLVRYGRGRVRLARKHREMLSLRCFLPALLVSGSLVGLPLAWASSWLAVAYVLALAIYGSTLVVTSATLTVRRRDLSVLPWLPLVFVVVHAGSGAGQCLETICLASRSRKQQVARAQP